MTAQAGAVALNPCKCGSPAEVDWGGVNEIAGRCWVQVSVSCTNPEKYGCFRGVSIEIGSDADRGHLAEAAAIAAWNAAYSPTPPAAVPVEALEGLVAAIRPVASMPLEEYAAFDNAPGNKRIFGANDWNLTVGDIRRLRAALANIERLIKERSNG